MKIISDSVGIVSVSGTIAAALFCESLWGRRDTLPKIRLEVTHLYKREDGRADGCRSTQRGPIALWGKAGHPHQTSL